MGNDLIYGLIPFTKCILNIKLQIYFLSTSFKQLSSQCLLQNEHLFQLSYGFSQWSSHCLQYLKNIYLEIAFIFGRIYCIYLKARDARTDHLYTGSQPQGLPGLNQAKGRKQEIHPISTWVMGLSVTALPEWTGRREAWIWISVHMSRGPYRYWKFLSF